ncbi:MAG: nicotinate-nucleotide adenylyltransferase [Planctomycetota bacterium]|jgi:nicotinate-nucleotide adenylyltransferase
MAGAGICLYGGSFNPPHRAHLRLAAAAVARLDPAQLLVVPCGDHALKAAGALAPARDRLVMCHLAFAGMDRVVVDPIEVERGGTSYTTDTLRALRERIDRDTPLFVLIGSDNLPELHRWHEPDALFELATVVTYPRPGYRVDAPHLARCILTEPQREHVLAHALRDVEVDEAAATAIRQDLGAGRDAETVPPAVLDYIREHGLYGAGRGRG